MRAFANLFDYKRIFEFGNYILNSLFSLLKFNTFREEKILK